MAYELIFEGEVEMDQLEKDTEVFTVLADNALVPSEETTYWCVVRRMPGHVVSRKHHAVKVVFCFRNSQSATKSKGILFYEVVEILRNILGFS